MNIESQYNNQVMSNAAKQRLCNSRGRWRQILQKLYFVKIKRREHKAASSCNPVKILIRAHSCALVVPRRFPRAFQGNTCVKIKKMKSKANFKIPKSHQISVFYTIIRCFQAPHVSKPIKSKPNPNPKQTQSKPKANPIRTQSKPISGTYTKYE